MHWLSLLLTFPAVVLADADFCASPSSSVLDTGFFQKISQEAQGALVAGKVCAETLQRYREAGCRLKEIRGFSPEGGNANFPGKPGGLREIPGGYFRVAENCQGDFAGVKRATIQYVRKPARAGNLPRTDECSERQHRPPEFFQSVTRTVTKRDPRNFDQTKQFPVIEDFQYTPAKGATLRLVSYNGEELRCYGGEFNPEQKKEVAYLYCSFQGVRISVPRKDQFSVIANGRFSVTDALALPEPLNFHRGGDSKVRPEQIIPVP
jgi:hypothetical protein